MLPIVKADPTINRELLVLAMGAGSLILSHVNDSGFWLVKEYFGMDIPDAQDLDGGGNGHRDHVDCDYPAGQRVPANVKKLHLPGSEIRASSRQLYVAKK